MEEACGEFPGVTNRIREKTTDKPKKAGTIFLSHGIRISEILSWDRKSYLTYAILYRLSREGYIHRLYWNSRTWSSSDVIVMLKSRHHVKLHLCVFRDFWKLILK